MIKVNKNGEEKIKRHLEAIAKLIRNVRWDNDTCYEEQINEVSTTFMELVMDIEKEEKK